MYQKVLTPNAQMTMTLQKDWTWYLVDSLWKTHQPSHRPSSMGLPTGELWEKFQKSIRTNPSYAPVYHHQASGIIEQHKHWECPAMPTLGSWQEDGTLNFCGSRWDSGTHSSLAAKMTCRLTMRIPRDLLGSPMQANLSQKEAKELLSALQCQADSWKTKPVKEDFQLCSTLRLQRTPRPFTLKGRNIRQAHSGDAIEGPILITRKIGARQLNIQVGFTAKGERRLEIQDIAWCKITHVTTSQEIAKKKPLAANPAQQSAGQRLANKKTTQLSPTAQPFIPHIIDTPSGDISTIVTLARRGASCGGGDCRRKNKFLKSGRAATPLPPPWHQYSIGNRTHLAGKTNAKRPNSTMETCYSCNCPLLFALV